MFYSNKMTALKYVFINFSEKIPIFWCIFIVYTLINGLIQGTTLIIESSYFIVNFHREFRYVFIGFLHL